jgi:hypothetical protein
MSLHKDLIDSHPGAPSIFDNWLDCSDIEPTLTRCHRALSSKLLGTDPVLIKWLAERLVYHHHDQKSIDRLKKKYVDLGFPQYAQYAEQSRKLPRTDKTKKGNATEIILIEYIESCLGRQLIKAFKLRYNPNVDQAVKGDDSLMVDIITDDKGKEKLKIFLGEAKFRATPSSQVIGEISKSLSKDKLPLSFSFLISMLDNDPANEETADLLDNFLISEIKAKGDVIYTGLLLSDTKTSATVEKHLATDNPQLIFISAGLDNPQSLIDEAFKEAEKMVVNPSVI